MNLRFTKLTLTCKKRVVTVDFSDFTYLYGEMGAGKSTVARLIDYCLGGGLERTPALQSEFVSVALDLEINGRKVRLERGDHAAHVLAAWGEGESAEQANVPTRKPDGEVIQGTKVEVLSDLIFYLAGVTSPRIRRSRIKEESGLQRLSFRDLWRYCYLDQESMDSNFYHLNAGANVFKQLKSKAVLGFLLGYNQQRVAELDAQLDALRTERSSLEQAGSTLAESLTDAGFETEADIDVRLQELQVNHQKVMSQIDGAREELSHQKTHLTDQLADQARELGYELVAVGDARTQVQETIVQYKRHINEMLALGTKVQRVAGARAVLNGLEFKCCPRCTQALPTRPVGDCPLCSQDETVIVGATVEVTNEDLSSRKKELKEMIGEREGQLQALAVRERNLLERKASIDQQYADEMKKYDTWYLSHALAAERKRAAIDEEVRYLGKLRALRSHIASLKERAKRLRADESEVRDELREARAAAEKDATNLDLLKQLFLDCLVRAKISGFRADDSVVLETPHFLPEVTGLATGDVAITSFATIGSGGKKTLFKCCFAIAVHRLARKLSSILPTVLIVDTPMKNISERENREQFEGFHQMLYELAGDELAGTQFLLIDKEFSPPTSEHAFDLVSRHMTVDKDDEPPLIPYYRERPRDIELSGEQDVESTEDGDSDGGGE